ncbi:MAG: orotate phosphoribosyltransferase [Variovorax sp.]
MALLDVASDSALAVAARLIDAGCVTVRTDEPFRLPSGWASPVYMDCRRLISFPDIRRELVALAINKLNAEGALADVAAVAGGEASGIAPAAWIADSLNLPLQYVRKRTAGANRVEGVVKNGGKVLLVDDLVAAGTSKASFVGTLRGAGATVEDVLVFFDYGTFEADVLLASLGLRLHALASWADVLAVARQRHDFGHQARAELAEFLRDPAAWSQTHGGIGPMASNRIHARKN